MKYSVQDYRLPEGAGQLDRGTLATWKGWVGWIRPVLAAAALMAVGHLAAGWLIGFRAHDPNTNPIRFLARWNSQPLPPLVSPSAVLGFIYGPEKLWEAIAVQFAAALAGTLLALLVIRRHARPALLGVIAGVVAAAVHVQVAGHLWTLHPLGYIGSVGVAVTSSAGSLDSVHVYAGSTAQSALGVLALWSPAIVGGLAGWWVGRHRARRARRAAQPAG